MEFFVDDCKFDLPRETQTLGMGFVGKAKVRKGLASRSEGIPDVHCGEDRHWTSEDGGALNGCTQVHKSGSHIEVRGCDLFEFRNGKVLRKDSYWKIVEK